MTTPTTCFYVSCEDDQEIDVFAFDTQSGEPSLRQKLVTDGGPQSLWVTADQQILLAGLCGTNSIQSFAIDQASGELRLLGRAAAPGEPSYVSSDQARKVVYSASYHGNSLSVFPLDMAGVPQFVSSIIEGLPHAHAALPDRSNRWLLTPMLAADALRIDRIQAAGGLAAGSPATVGSAPGSGPRHLVFSPDNRQVYCLNELDGSIDRYDFDAGQGQLTPRQTISLLPPGFALKPWAAELRLTPNGRFLYATERSASVIAAFAVNGSDGQLTLIGHYSTETQPRGMGIDPSGQWLIAVGQQSARLTVYAINPATGRLTTSHEHPTGKNPLWVQFALLPGR